MIRDQKAASEVKQEWFLSTWFLLEMFRSISIEIFVSTIGLDLSCVIWSRTFIYCLGRISVRVITQDSLLLHGMITCKETYYHALWWLPIFIRPVQSTAFKISPSLFIFCFLFFIFCFSAPTEYGFSPLKVEPMVL